MSYKKYSEIVSNLESFDPKIGLTILGVTDINLASFFAQEFEPEISSPSAQITSEEEKRFAQKASIFKFTRITRLLELLRRDLMIKSKKQHFVDPRPGQKPGLIRNQEIFSKEILEKRSEIINYIAKAHGRCLLLVEFLVNSGSLDPRVKEIIDLLFSWLSIFDNIAFEFTKGSSSDLNEYQKKLELSKKGIANIIKIYEKRYGKILSDESLNKLINLLDPKFGSEISQKILTEYLDTSLTLNTMRILNRLSSPVEINKDGAKQEIYPELNLPEIKLKINNIYTQAYEIKNNSNLKNSSKKDLLKILDEKFKQILTPLGNKISFLFPHKFEDSGSNLVEILADENAVCVGKTQIVRVLGDYLGLKNPQFTTASHNNVGRHTFNLFELPSGNKLIIDCNFQVDDPNLENKFAFLTLEEFEPDEDVDMQRTSVVLDSAIGKYKFYQILDEHPKEKQDVHQNFLLLRDNNLISPLVFVNFFNNNTFLKYQDYLRISGFPNSDFSSKSISDLFTSGLNFFPPFKLEGVSEDFFIFIIRNKNRGYSLATMVLNTDLESIKNFKDNRLLEDIYSFLENLKVTTPLVFKFNYYNEVEKLEYLKQKLGKV